MIDYAFIAVFLLLSSTHTWLLYPQNRNPQVETSLHMLQQQGWDCAKEGGRIVSVLSLIVQHYPKEMPSLLLGRLESVILQISYRYCFHKRNCQEWKGTVSLSLPWMVVQYIYICIHKNIFVNYFTLCIFPILVRAVWIECHYSSEVNINEMLTQHRVYLVLKLFLLQN